MTDVTIKEAVSAHMIRRTLKTHETAKRVHGEIERYLYAIEIACPDEKRAGCCMAECPFYDNKTRCKLWGIRDLIGEHNEHLKQCEYQREMEWSLDQPILCGYDMECEHQTSSSDGMTVYCSLEDSALDNITTYENK